MQNNNFTSYYGFSYSDMLDIGDTSNDNPKNIQKYAKGNTLIIIHFFGVI